MAIERNPEQVRFDVLRNALYHTARRRHFDRLDRWGNFLVVAFGATTVVKAAGDLLGPNSTQIFGLITTFIGAAKLAFGFSAAARTHESLQRRYYSILADIEEHPNPSADDVRRWQAAMVKITADEPPTNLLSDAIAYNEAANSLGYAESAMLHIPWVAEIRGRIFPLHGCRFETIDERRERLSAK